VTVEFFIYFIFLPIAIIPTVLIHHAGRYTLPYPCRRSRNKKRAKLSKKSSCRGVHLARYYSNLRNKSTVINRTITSKGDHRNSTENTSKSNTTFSTTADAQVAALIADSPSISLDLFLFEAKLYWDSMPSPSSTTILFPSNAIDIFLHSFNVIDHYRNITSLLPSSHHSHPSSSSQYTSIDPSCSQFQRILLEARGLQTSIRQYGEILPLSSPAIYVSPNKDHLPIVIDTGASCTITPTLSDFISKPTKSDTATLGSLTTVQTKVSGQGLIEWDIEDVDGVLTKLRTVSYYVP
jgi:hypothetical protein